MIPESLRRVLDRQNATPSIGYAQWTFRDGTSLREYADGRVQRWPDVPALPDDDNDPFPR